MAPEKIELVYPIVFHIYFAASQFLAAFCLVRLCRKFTDRKKKTALIGGAYFFVTLFFYYVPFPIENFLVYSLALLAALGIFVWLDRECIRTKIFLFFTFFVMRWTAFGLSTSFANFLQTVFEKILLRRVELFDLNLSWYYFIIFLIVNVLELICCGTLLALMVWMLDKIFLYRQRDLDFWELAVLLLPSVNGMVVYGIYRIYITLYERDAGSPLFQNHAVLEIVWVLCYLVVLATIFSTVFLYGKIRKKQEEETAGLILEGQMKDMRIHITEMEKMYADMRSVKHDIKNHLEVINGLLVQGKAEAAREYAHSLSETAEISDFCVKTGHPVTDVILHEKRSMALAKNIQFTSDFHYPADAGMDVFDVSVILSNALSNAIEAAEAGGFIKISSFRNKNSYLLTVENSYDGKLRIDKESGLPKTKKEDRRFHGFGLYNIRSAALKYHGDVLIEQKEDRVLLTVLLMP